ncbi:hypothetical protein CCR75_001189 [Bremia lactucae]|uniref:Uncharacterized protein n=1 Tax=Bremia lactucae TaxID=4779 RepID=A0A976IFR1_BRELC|nr:hypothetical protein CCR75_001189 [Bremia lactucae]
MPALAPTTNGTKWSGVGSILPFNDLVATLAITQLRTDGQSVVKPALERSSPAFKWFVNS